MLKKMVLLILMVTGTLCSAKTRLNLELPTMTGKASWYGKREQGHRTASGERFDRNRMTCASRTYPLGTLLVVRYERTKLEVVVRVNDRGPWIKGRILDLSEQAAKSVGLKPYGVGQVEIRIFHPEAL